MKYISFEWDEKKNSLNQEKHGVSFDEAKSVFYDENAIEFFDHEHSNEEDRFLMLGRSFSFRIILVCHCVRGKGSKIRIISARKATKNEQKFYKG
jgi:uncharacterized DUF497 family protein